MRGIGGIVACACRRTSRAYNSVTIQFEAAVT
jgi:hypothetical protein